MENKSAKQWLGCTLTEVEPGKWLFDSSETTGKEKGKRFMLQIRRWTHGPGVVKWCATFNLVTQFSFTSGWEHFSENSATSAVESQLIELAGVLGILGIGYKS